ncbi:uncharacterized protein BT62DRAFT_883844 [Guyanagaster necrorhizus]|uniref:Uncharacterized protein n=1 Tax=Guyanagaster necrorhizus TaxID=856835 RepID=A0A9P7W3U2_9AGAR|nr:uncharacterized protein BT62DRAFT_883844 [Guyanagaster necrorhizus MCA 3950]KAG7451604.1 hypothetical protein BT62DRAFT_883844 [Guyanagaster necrorhizus MCA 3950]
MSSSASTSSDRPDLPAGTLVMERTNLIGDCLSQIFFGAIVVVFLQTMYALVYLPHRRGEKRNWFLIAYTFVSFTFATTFISVNMKWLQLMFIDHRNHAGGPIGFSMTQYSQPAVATANVVGVMCGWMADGYLLYRCLVIFHFRLYVITLPILIYLGTLAMGSLFLFQALRPGASLFSHLSVNFGVPYFAMTAGLNVLISLLIAGRLLMYRRQLNRLFGREYAAAAPYVSAAALVVESSFIYAINSICFVIPYGLGSHVANIFLPLQALAPVLAPMLIMFRVALQQAWDTSTLSAPVSSLQFRSKSAPTFQEKPIWRGEADGIYLPKTTSGESDSNGSAQSSSKS